MSWINTLKPLGGERVVADGRVRCPSTRTDVDVERCYVCTTDHELIDAIGDEPAYVVCSGRPSRPVGLRDIIA